MHQVASLTITPSTSEGRVFTLDSLFPGSSGIDQLYRVLQVLGKPNPKTWPGVDALPDFGKIAFPPITPTVPKTQLHPRSRWNGTLRARASTGELDHALFMKAGDSGGGGSGMEAGVAVEI